MQKIVYLLIALVFGSILISPAIASPGDGISSYEDTIPEVTPTPSPNNNNQYAFGTEGIQNLNNGVLSEYPVYDPSSVTLLFTSCLTANVNVSSYGHYNYNVDSAGVITVYPSEIGSYAIHFQVVYDRVTNQTVSLIIQGGTDIPPTRVFYASCNTGFTLDIAVDVRVQPRPATAEEIAAASNDFTQQIVENQSRQYSESLAHAESLSYIAVSAVVVTIVLAVVFVLLFVRWFRRSDRRQSEFEMMFPKFEQRSE